MQQSDINREMSECDRIDIRKTGLIQDFGYLLVFDSNRSKLLACSGNLQEDFPQYANSAEALELISGLPKSLPEYSVDFIPMNLEIKNIKFALFAHNSPEGELIVELEPLGAWSSNDQNVHTLTVEAAWRASRVNDFDDLYVEIVNSVQAISGFYRVMVYKFHPDLHGEVVGETVRGGEEKYLGLHYPATDIPKLARDMYLSSRIRHISDVEANPVAIDSHLDEPINLNGSFLRGVSPVHIRYLLNMGVKSSFSISLVVHDRLWGLIACHHDQPTRFSPTQRASLDLLGRTYSSAIERIIAKKHAKDYRKSVKHLNQLFRMATSTEHLETLITGEQSIASLISCDACALFEGEKLVACSLPNVEKALAQLSDSLFTPSPDLMEILVVEDLVKSNRSTDFAGFLKIPIGTESGDAIVFFRREAAREVNWAGKDSVEKNRANHQDPRRLEPRESFALWKEEIKGCCKPWSERDLNRAKLLQDFFLTYWVGLLKQKNQAVSLHSKQLELFINMASHDIKSPLRAINYNVGMVRELLEKPSKETTELFKQTEGAVFRIERILDEFLSLSKESRKNTLQLINPTAIVEHVSDEISASYPGFEVITIDFPKYIKYSRTHFEQICANICGNAAKFAGTNNPVKVIYRCEDSNRSHKFSFIDQGDGIPENKLEAIFKPFYKLGAESDEGHGLGLAICRRILGYYGGSISAANIEPRGTEIRVEIPKLL